MVRQLATGRKAVALMATLALAGVGVGVGAVDAQASPEFVVDPTDVVVGGSVTLSATGCTSDIPGATYAVDLLVDGERTPIVIDIGPDGSGSTELGPYTGSDVEAGPRTYGALCLWFTESDGGELFTYEQTYTVTVSAAPTTTTTSTTTAPTTSTTRGPARAAAVAPAYTG